MKSFLLIAAILSFAVLTFYAKQYDYFNFDLAITLYIQKYNFGWFEQLMRFITILGNAPAVIILVSSFTVYSYLKGRRITPLLLIISTAGGGFLSYVLKFLISRPRPDPLLIKLIVKNIESGSFPSGHVLTAVSLYGFIFYIAYTQLKKSIPRKILLGICFSIIFLMGISRIYLGVHWFSDVLGAYLIGFVWLSVIIFLYHKFKKVRM